MHGFARTNFTRGTIVARNQDGVVEAFEVSSATLIAADPHVKGAYVEFVSSLPVDAFGFWLSIGNTFLSGNARNALVDIAVGDVGSESVVVANIPGGSATQDGKQFYFTGLSLPTGTRLSGRVSSNSSGHTAAVRLYADTVLRTDRSETAYVTYGSNPTSSVGTSVTPGTGIFGTWTGVGTTTRQHKMWTLGLDGLNDGSFTAETYQAQVGYGPGVNSVVPFVDNFIFILGAAETIAGPIPACAFATVSSGHGLWVRLNASVSAEARGVTLHGN